MRQVLDLAFDFEWANRNLFYGLYDRTVSFFENSPMKAVGEPSEAERELLTGLGVIGAGRSARTRLPAAQVGRLRSGPEPFDASGQAAR